MALTAVILAAGKGTRMKSALPKVLHKIANKPIVEHIIETVQSLDCESINLVYGHGAEQLESTLAAHQLNWCLQQEQLGTGHAVMQALPYIDDTDDVLILVGDAPLISADTLHALIKAKKTAPLALLTVNMADPAGMGRIIRDNGNITAIVEHKDATDEQRQIKEINTGIMIMGGADLKRWLADLSNNNAQSEYYLTDVIAMAADEGKTIGSAQPFWDKEVEGINNRLQLANLERALQQKIAEGLMLEGVTLADPHRIDVRGELSVGTDVFIDVNAVFEGRVSLGDNVKIGPNCVLKDCSIASNTTIEAFSHIQDAFVGESCNIGPYARLRPGSVLDNKAKIGNFVETKKAHIGEGSKVNHLSYIGDAELGENVNIGAGTITCNYDGVNKSKTTIGNDVFVGSNSSLVAPIKLGHSTIVGAGSIITKNVADEDLAISRSRQRNISGWKRPVKKDK
ncbi:MAG: bifunctional UDP-N-acetylglucosamine diphosphorylase/glucosamine-1-phosphate N-acetyltransferase GlmU [Pseudomonadota bacterium]